MLPVAIERIRVGRGGMHRSSDDSRAAVSRDNEFIGWFKKTVGNLIGVRGCIFQDKLNGKSIPIYIGFYVSSSDFFPP